MSPTQQTQDLKKLKKDELIELLEEKLEVEEVKEEEVVGPTSPKWQEYLLKQLTKDELVDEYPKLNGLRRLAEIYVGDIISIDSDVRETANSANNYKCTVVVGITFISDGHEIHFDGEADADSQNTENQYSKYPTAVAGSRAESRALRRALRLSRCSAEELEGFVNDYEMKEKGGLSASQSVVIKNLCKRLDINVDKLVEKEKIELTYKGAQQFLEILNKLQQKSSLITDDIRGYKETNII